MYVFRFIQTMLAYCHNMCKSRVRNYLNNACVLTLISNLKKTAKILF